MVSDARGSVWRRWDPHVHAPGTVLNDQFGDGSFEDYIHRLEAVSPPLEALGITDYLTTGCYEAVLAAKNDGRLAGVHLLFANIEMRLSIETNKGKGLNLHLLVSPDDSDHLAQVQRFLARLNFEYRGDRYACTTQDLVRLGRAHDPAVTDDSAALGVGVNQFKVNFPQLREEYQASDWMRRNSLVAVSGSSNDGTSGLQPENAGFAAIRKEIERFAHIIFASGEHQAQFWRGEGVASVAQLQADYGGRKPCLHGSDAHRLEDVGAPDLDRFTWLKGDPIFETLRQACLEPGSRVFVGPMPPELANPARTISEVATPGTAWLLDAQAVINPGLVAIIGARGSGKTALADLIAHGGGNSSPLDTRDSFLNRAAPFLADTQVVLRWSDGTSAPRPVSERTDEFDSQVHYLSQQFVERLCSSDGASDELIQEIEKVVFTSHEPASRMEATSFAELLDAHLGDTRRQKVFLQQQLDRIAQDVLTERTRRQQLPALRTALQQLRGRIASDRKRRDSIVKAGEQERAAYYERLHSAIEARERAIQAASRQVQALEHLQSTIARYRRTVFPELLQQLQTEFTGLGWDADDWARLAVDFTGQPDVLVTTRLDAARRRVHVLRDGDPAHAVTIAAPPETLAIAPLTALNGAFAQVSAEIGIDRQNAQRLRSLNSRISAAEIGVEKAEEEVLLCEGADERFVALAQARALSYQEYFELVVAEEAILRDLYRPLEQQLEGASDTVGRLRLVVVRHVDVDRWAEHGEQLLDLRKAGSFRGRGALAEFARERLVPAWEQGSAAEVSKAMAAFRQEYDAALMQQSSADRTLDPDGFQRWVLDVGRWLYSTDHIEVQYSFQYENVPLSQLSPGTRGIVLLLLYLALDLEDARPLIIDQPEENLDPRSVFAELVELFRGARSRRQVIIVTHNANLVVNTDVDQVIVATCVRPGEGKPPVFVYQSGSLENARIRTEVCEILEGGEAAFRERARRLRVW